MKRIFPILALLCFAIGQVTAASAQGLADMMIQVRRESVAPEDADELLQIALYQDKALGQIDSAAVLYRRVLKLYSLRQASRETARHAQVRVAWLRASGLLTGNNPESGIWAETWGAPTAEQPHQSGAQPEAAVLTYGLQLGALPTSLQRHTTATNTLRSLPLDARKRWLAKVTLARRAPVQSNRPEQPSILQSIGSGLAAFNSMLGLKGLLYYVEQEVHRSRPRLLSLHEQLLLALVEEREYADFGSAIGRYRNVVQRNPNSGILTRDVATRDVATRDVATRDVATRLSERARQGIERCSRWQRITPAGS